MPKKKKLSKKKKAKLREFSRDKELDNQHGKKQTIYTISTTTGPMFAVAGERLAVRLHNRVTTVPVEHITPDMHVICSKEILSHLTLQDVHNDLMNSNDADSFRYRDYHQLLHMTPPKGFGLPLDSEIPYLRQLIFRNFEPYTLDETTWIPSALKGEKDFYKKLFKVDGEDFDNDVYRQITSHIRNKIARKKFDKSLKELEPEEKSKVPSHGLLSSWLRGEVRMPIKRRAVTDVAKVLDDSDIQHLNGYSHIGRFWGGRRAALMSYIGEMKGEAVPTDKKEERKPTKDALTEINTILKKRIKEVQDQTVTVGINNITTSNERPGEFKKNNPRVKKLSKTLIRSSTKNPETFENELNRAGYDHEGLDITNWENDEEIRKITEERKRKREQSQEDVPDFGDFWYRTSGEKERDEEIKKAEQLLNEKKKKEKELEEHETRLAKLEEEEKHEQEKEAIYHEFQEKFDLEQKLTIPALKYLSKQRSSKESLSLGEVSQVIEFIGLQGLNEKRFREMDAAERKTSSDMLNGKIITSEDYVNSLIKNNHSIAIMHRNAYRSSDTLKKKYKSAVKFLKKLHLHDFNNYRGMRKKLKTVSPDEAKKRLDYVDELHETKFNSSLELFNFIKENHSELADSLHRATKKLPHWILPYSYARVIESRKNQKAVHWTNSNIEEYEDAMMEDGYPYVFVTGKKRKREINSRQLPEK